MSGNEGSTVEGSQDTDIRMPRFYFEEYLGALDAVVDESAVTITEDGLESRAVDPANVSMVRTELSSSGLSEFDGGEAEFGIRTRKLSNLIESIDDAFLDLEYDSDTRKLDLASKLYRYTHATIQPGSLRNRPELPELDLSFKAKMNIDQLREAVEWFDEFTTHLRVGYDPDERTFWMEAMERTRSNDIGTDDGEFELDHSELGYVHESGHADSTFSIDYFRDIVQAVPEGYPVTIEVGEEYPMRLSYEIGWEETGPNEGFAHGEVTFIQAPRIQSD